MKQKLIIGNWKMWPETLVEAKKTFTAIRKIADEHKKVTTVTCPPFVYLSDLSRLAAKSKQVYVGAQDVSMESKGAFTGEVNASMLSDLGLGYCIVGHSERRAMGENDEVVNKKIHTLLSTNIKVVLCVGEKTRDPEGNYLAVLKSQMKQSLARVERRRLDSIIIAYEPVWAIGRKDFKAMNSHEIHESVIFIKKSLIELYGSDVAGAVPVLYGGSINLENARDILYEGGSQGLLVGRTSQNVKEFGEILKIADKA
jgi:triosephosphate isomerase